MAAGTSSEHKKAVRNAWIEKRFRQGFCKSCKGRSHLKGKTTCAVCRAKSVQCNRKSRTGATRGYIQHLLQIQDHRCAICAVTISINADMDHDHITGQLRGLLCKSCNMGIGYFKDNPARLRAAMSYCAKWAGILN